MPKSPVHKRIHELHACRSGAELLAGLEAAGVHIHERVAALLRPGCPFALLAVGSVAEGTATPESDLDLMVLIDSEDDFVASANVLNLAAGRSREVLFYIEGLEVNIDFMSRDRMEPIIESMLSLAPALYDPRDVKEVPLLAPGDVTFLHRLRTGWVLEGDDTVALWRDEFMVDILPMYLGVRCYYSSVELLEDAISVLRGPSPAAYHVGRSCVEYTLMAVLTQEGFTSMNPKWLVHWVHRTGGDTRALLDRGARLLFPVVGGPDEERAYVGEVAAFVRGARARLDRDPAIARAIEYLRGEIAYVDLDGA